MYKLYNLIAPEGFKNSEFQQWLFSAFRVTSLAERVKDRDDVMLENAPPPSHLLNDIMEAIESRHVLHFTYKSHFKEPKICEFQPAFVRLFRQQWYVIGVIKDTERTVTYVLERMRDITTLQDSFCFTSKQAAMLKPEQYFKHCFGVIRQYEPIRICFRAFWP